MYEGEGDMRHDIQANSGKITANEMKLLPRGSFNPCGVLASHHGFQPSRRYSLPENVLLHYIRHMKI